MGTPFHLYAVWGPNESKWKFGLGAYTPFGSSVSWGDTWQGKYLLNEISLQAIYVQATASYKIIEGLSIGAGFVANFGSVTLKRSVDATANGEQTSITLDGKSDIGYGYNVGVYWSPISKIQVGLSYRSQIDAVVNGGDVTFQNVPSSLASLLYDNKFNATLPMPSSLNIGVNFASSDKFSWGVEANYVGWSAYESLNIDFLEENIGVQDTDSPREYENSWVFHLGGEYTLLNMLQLRAGGYYDLSPVKEGFMTPETPDSNRIGLTAGVGITLIDKLQIDVSFLYINGQQREQTTSVAQQVGTYPSATNDTYAVEPGTYKLQAYIPGISVAYKF
jgi:long-chain fatty acid transport protein